MRIRRGTMRGFLAPVLLIALAAGVLFGGATATRAQVTDWTKIKYPPLRSFPIPEPERYVMKNGIVVLLLEDHELPMIDVSARIRTGSRLEPADKVGVAQLTGLVLRTGGAKGRSGDEIDDWLDARGARIETSIGMDAGTASLSCLKGNFPEVFQLFADILRSPAFEESKLKVARSQAMTGISRRNDNPMGIMFREFRKMIYGQESPYARTAEYSTIGSVTQADLKSFHDKYYIPNRLLLGVTGDFDGKEMKALLERTFGDWAKGPDFKDPEAAYAKKPNPGLYRVVKNDMTQSDIIMGHLGVREDNPDFFALEVMNQVLSGSFASRLFSNVRTKKGLAYAVQGSMDADFDHPGSFNVWVTTKTETTAAATDALLEEVDGIVNHPATEEEVAKAKQAMLSSFVFNYDSRAKILKEQLAYEYFGYPRDFLAKYRDNIEKVTPADVARVAKQYVHRNDLAIIVVGKKEGIDRPLESFGKVAELDITIPEPASAGSATASAPGVGDAEAVSKGAEILKRVIAALGGAEKVDAVKSLRIVSQNSAVTPRGEMSVKATTLAVLPNRIRQEMSTPMGSVTMVVTPADAFMNTPMGLKDLEEPQRTSITKAIGRLPFLLLQRRSQAGFSARYAGTETVDNRKTDLLALAVDGETIRYAIDSESGRILQATYKGKGPSGEPGDVVSTFSDFREAGGLTLPFKSRQTFGGEQVGSSDVQEIVVNAPIDDSQFARPLAAASVGGGK